MVKIQSLSSLSTSHCYQVLSEECELDGPGVQYTFYEITLASFVIDPSQNVVINYPSNPNELSYPWIYYEPHTYPCHGVLNVCGKQKKSLMIKTMNGFCFWKHAILNILNDIEWVEATFFLLTNSYLFFGNYLKKNMMIKECWKQKRVAFLEGTTEERGGGFIFFEALLKNHSND